jgi:hypothetical protein
MYSLGSTTPGNACTTRIIWQSLWLRAYLLCAHEWVCQRLGNPSQGRCLPVKSRCVPANYPYPPLRLCAAVAQRGAAWVEAGGCARRAWPGLLHSALAVAGCLLAAHTTRASAWNLSTPVLSHHQLPSAHEITAPFHAVGRPLAAQPIYTNRVLPFPEAAPDTSTDAQRRRAALSRRTRGCQPRRLLPLCLRDACKRPGRGWLPVPRCVWERGSERVYRRQTS